MQIVSDPAAVGGRRTPSPTILEAVAAPDRSDRAALILAED